MNVTLAWYGLIENIYNTEIELVTYIFDYLTLNITYDRFGSWAL